MKKVLFITYYFPPSGGPGVQRSLKFVRYLPRFGWQPTVLTVDPDYAAYPAIDAGLVHEIPESVEVIRTRASDPYSAYARFFGRKRNEVIGVGFLSHERAGFKEKMARWIRANFFLPDARKGWVRHAEAAAVNALESNSFDAIFSTGPPHSTHLIAKRMAERFGLPWILDLRDAWPPDSYAHLLPMTRWAKSRDEKIKAEAFSASDLVLAVSESLRRDAAPVSNTPVEVLPNGFDDDDFDAVEPLEDSDFTILYAGHLSAEQNPIALWHTLKYFKSKGEWNNVRVRLVGNVAGEVIAAIEQAGLMKYVDLVPYVEHAEAVRYICGADMLLLSINRVPNPGGIVTGKLYEYLASTRPILCLSSTSGDAAEIIHQLDAGECFRYEDGNGVGQMIDRHYRAWSDGVRLSGAAKENLVPYSRRTHAKQLSDLLTRLTEPDE